MIHNYSRCNVSRRVLSHSRSRKGWLTPKGCLTARGHRAHRVRYFLRQGLIILLAYLMLLGPAGLQQLAQASSQYSNITTGDWATNKYIEYEYDANGSCIRKTTKNASNEVVEDITYDYNIRNKLSRMSRAFTDWEGSIVETTQYTYNDSGDLAKTSRYRTVNGGPPEGQDGKAFLIDPFNHTGFPQVLLESYGGIITTYTIGDDVLAQAGEDAYFGQISKHFIRDGHGSTRQLTDNNGDVIYDQVFNYDAYGVLVGYAGEIEEPLTNLLYAGEYYDTHLRQYNLRARWYDPYNGRFNQIDPYMGNNYDPQSLHKYLYCHANPVNAVDPSGEFGIFGISAAIFTGLGVFFGADYIFNIWLGTETPTAQDIQAVNHAIRNARNFVWQTKQKLVRMNPSDKVEYEKWFGTYEHSRWTRVRECYQRITGYLHSGFKWYKKDNDKYGECDLFGRIFFGRLFWSAPPVATPGNWESQAGTVVHELSHKAGITKDYKYGVYDCKDLALTSPRKAVKNADNYAYYAESVP
jgi:RHS repeat-associated protein